MKVSSLREKVELSNLSQHMSPECKTVDGKCVFISVNLITSYSKMHGLGFSLTPAKGGEGLTENARS